MSLSQILSETHTQKHSEESATKATVESLDRSSFFNGKNKKSRRNRNPAHFKRHRTQRIDLGRYI